MSYSQSGAQKQTLQIFFNRGVQCKNDNVKLTNLWRVEYQLIFQIHEGVQIVHGENFKVGLAGLATGTNIDCV
jgi:hypothetical protein